MKNWYNILTPFYAIRGGIVKFLYGFVMVYVCRLSPTNWKLPVLVLLGMIIVYLINKLIFSVFELIVTKSYQRDPCNYVPNGFVINKKTKKIENANHFVTIRERYKNPKYREELEDRFEFLHYNMFCIGLMMGYCIPRLSINM